MSTAEEFGSLLEKEVSEEDSNRRIAFNSAGLFYERREEGERIDTALNDGVIEEIARLCCVSLPIAAQTLLLFEKKEYRIEGPLMMSNLEKEDFCPYVEQATMAYRAHRKQYASSVARRRMYRHKIE